MLSMLLAIVIAARTLGMNMQKTMVQNITATGVSNQSSCRSASLAKKEHETGNIKLSRRKIQPSHGGRLRNMVPKAAALTVCMQTARHSKDPNVVPVNAPKLRKIM